jgi:hypothetical protein
VARWAAGAKWAAGPAPGDQRDTPLVLSLSEGLGHAAFMLAQTVFEHTVEVRRPFWIASRRPWI